MANIFQKLGSAFGQYGMDNRMPTDQFLNLPKGDRRQMQVQGLQKFGEAMNLIGAQQSGNSSRVTQAQNAIRQRQLDEEDARRKAEQEAKQKQLKEQQDAFIKANPQYAKMINMNKLFGVNPPAKKDRRIVLQNGIQYYADTGEQVLPNAPDKTPPKKSKNDFVVGILEKIQADPNYELTTADQRILDTIADTDPMKIMVRNRLNEMQTSKFSNENNNQSGLVTVTTQKEFDDLPVGTTYIYDGAEYVKGQ